MSSSSLAHRGFTSMPRRLTVARDAAHISWYFAAVIVTGVMLWPRPGRCFPWSTDMFHGQFVRPMERTPRNQPAGALAENALPTMSQQSAAAKLQNPLPPTPLVLSKGRFLFLTDCAPCHDSKGTGNGPVLAVLETKPKDLTTGEPAKLSDGAIFATIRDGFKSMPPYGDTLTENEAWELISYVRHLQMSSR